MKDLCVHFGTCGGCDFQDIRYEEQLKVKEARIVELFSPFAGSSIERIVPSPEIYDYRNKMEYAVTSDKGSLFLGLRQKRRFYRIVDLAECRIFFKGVEKIFAIFREWIVRNNIEPYQWRRHTGKIRYAAMRHSKYYDQLMVIVVLTSEDESITSLVEELKKIDKVKSVYSCINEGLADVSVAGSLKLLYGESHIKERINDIDYLISPDSFFQTNPYCCNKLYGIIKEETKNFGAQALDVCCGAGGITLQVADNFEKVTGVDISARNIEDAVVNARINKKNNVEFVCDDAQNFILNPGTLNGKTKFSTIILDPPRAGLSKKIKEAVSSSGVENIVYVSCNPANLALDLKDLEQAYSVEKIMPVDMFPHTRHLEVIAILKRRDV